MKDFAREEESTWQNGWECKGPGVGMCSVSSENTKEPGWLETVSQEEEAER